MALGLMRSSSFAASLRLAAWRLLTGKAGTNEIERALGGLDWRQARSSSARLLQRSMLGLRKRNPSTADVLVLPTQDH